MMKPHLPLKKTCAATVFLLIIACSPPDGSDPQHQNDEQINLPSISSNGLNLELKYEMSSNYVGVDYDRYVLLKTSGSSRGAVLSRVSDPSQFSFSFAGRRGKSEHHRKVTTTMDFRHLAKSIFPPEIQAQAANPEVFNEETTVRVLNALTNTGLETRKKEEKIYDIETMSMKTTHSKRQKLVRTNYKYCEEIRTYTFFRRGPDTPCSTLISIKKQYIQPTGRHAEFIILIKEKGNSNFKSQTIRCEFYGNPGQIGVKPSEKCISFFGKIPVVIVEENRSGFKDSASVIYTKLTSIDFAPQFPNDVFEIDANKLCTNLENDERWSDC